MKEAVRLVHRRIVTGQGDAMRTILVPVENQASSEPILRTALLLGRMMDGYIEGFALGPDMPDVYGLEVPVVLPPVLDELSRRDMAAQARKRFEDFMHAQGIAERFGEPSGLSYGWHGDVLEGDTFLGNYGRAFDVIVVGRPSSDPDSPRMTTLEEALFDSGRAVLVAPPSAPKEIGRSIVIAWNGSTETARAVSLAMPILLKAAKVTVLTVRGGTVLGPAGEHIARTLRINGIPAQALDVDDEGRSVGEPILAYAEDLGADLLVKGAYTQSRLRQMIFGGPTRYLLEHSTLPVLMAH
jgi:nucleotide-binding universal stress UspA family protein